MNEAMNWNDRRDLLAQIGILERERNAALAKLKRKEKAHDVTRHMLKLKSAELILAKDEMRLLAKLASDTPQFYNPLLVADAKKIRNRILSENAGILP